MLPMSTRPYLTLLSFEIMCVNIENRLNEKQGTRIKSKLAQQTSPCIRGGGKQQGWMAENTTQS